MSTVRQSGCMHLLILLVFLQNVILTQSFHQPKYGLHNKQHIYSQLHASNEALAWFSSINRFFPSSSSSAVSKANQEVDVCILGAGMAGLSCATNLHEYNQKKSVEDAVTFLCLEQDKRVGGRVHSEVLTRPEGNYILDCGFGVYIDGYPEVKALLEGKLNSKLRLRPFLPGALVKQGGRFYRISDPFRRPQDILASLNNPIGSIVDKIKVGIYTIQTRLTSVQGILDKEGRFDRKQSTRDFLASKGFSANIIDTFFAPFYQGIFLSPLELQSPKMFEFIYKMFGEGDANLPELGMQSVANTIADSLPTDSLSLSSKVTSVKKLSNGKYEINYEQSKNKSKVIASKVVMACDPVNAQKLLLQSSGIGAKSTPEKLSVPNARGSTCMYFAFDGKPPISGPILVLNGEGRISPEAFQSGNVNPLINNMCFPSEVSAAYAPTGKSLAVVTMVGVRKETDVDLEKLLRSELQRDWFPNVDIASWEKLKTYRIPYAQPAQDVTTNYTPRKLSEDVFVVGDYTESPTVHGAVKSGRLAAVEIIASSRT